MNKVKEKDKNKDFNDLIKQKKYNWHEIQKNLNISRQLRNQNKSKDALKILKKTFKNNPVSDIAREIALTYFYEKEYKQAIKYYKTVMDLEFVNFSNCYDLACAYHYNGDIVSAYKFYMHSLSINPKNINAINNLGCLYYETKNYEEAVKIFEKSLILSKNNPEAHFYMGILHRCFLKDFTLSVLHFKKAIFQDPKHLETYIELIKTYSEMGDKNNQEKIKKYIKNEFPNYN